MNASDLEKGQKVKVQLSWRTTPSVGFIEAVTEQYGKTFVDVNVSGAEDADSYVRDVIPFLPSEVLEVLS